MPNHWFVRSKFLLITLLVAVSAGRSEAETQTTPGDDASVFDLVEECDVLAAHPDDPERMATGVADDAIVPRLAILACEQSIENDPDEPRFQFQLGRALLAVGRKTEAVVRFQKAADSDYAAARAYMGDAYQFGLGTKQDTAKALQSYQAALKGGFEAAKSQIEQLKFDGSRYVSSTINAIYRGNFRSVRSQSSNAILRNYLFSFTHGLLQECSSFLKPHNLVGLYVFRYPSGWTPKADEDIRIAVQTSVAEFDAASFLKRHGCEGPVAKQLFENMNSFFKSQ